MLHGVVHLAPEVRLLQDHVSAVAGWLEGTPVQSVGGITSYTPVASAHKIRCNHMHAWAIHTHSRKLAEDSGGLTRASFINCVCCCRRANQPP